MNSADDWVGVTTVAKVINPGEGLLRWANAQGLKGVSLANARKSGTGAGMGLHQQVERLVAGEIPSLVRMTAPQAYPLSGFTHALLGWWEATEPEPLYCEQNIASERLMARGRVDLVRRCAESECYCHGEGARITDFKSGGHRIYSEAHLQGDGYREIWHDAGLAPRHLCGVEFLTLSAKDLSWRVQPLRAQPGDFLAALELWRRLERLASSQDGYAAMA